MDRYGQQMMPSATIPPPADAPPPPPPPPSSADRTDWTGHQFEHFPRLQKAYNDLFGAAADELDELIADLRAESAAAAPVALPRSKWLGRRKRGRR